MPIETLPNRSPIHFARGTANHLMITVEIGYAQSGSTLIRKNKQNLVNQPLVNGFVVPLSEGTPDKIDIITSIFDVNPSTDRLSASYHIQYGQESRHCLIEENSDGDGTSKTLLLFVEVGG